MQTSAVLASSFRWPLISARPGGSALAIRASAPRGSGSASAASASATDDDPAPVPRAAGPILIVDDDIDVREALEELLADHGYPVITASNGAEALALLRSLEALPSVILLDIMMPVLDGYGFLEARRNDPVLGSVPVAVVTAAHSVDRARVDRAVPIVHKPLNVPQLMATLERLRGTDK